MHTHAHIHYLQHTLTPNFMYDMSKERHLRAMDLLCGERPFSRNDAFFISDSKSHDGVGTVHSAKVYF